MSGVTSAFVDRWRELGGVVVNQVRYSGENAGYSDAVKSALSIDASEARAAALRQTLGRAIHFDPQPRNDIDAVFIAGFPNNTRQLMPQFRYFRASNLPFYATSHTYSGQRNAGADQDLDGLRFGDMPWLFDSSSDLGGAAFRRAWRTSAPGAGRLFAFGVDAYQLIPNLARLRQQPSLRIPGYSGTLRMTTSGRVVRSLSWARFAKGVPRALQN